MIHMPFGLAALAHMRWLNWGYATDPEPQLKNRRLYWPRGRVLGGSSSINAMIYMRGHPQDYRDWAAAAGPDWDWPQVRAGLQGPGGQSRAYRRPSRPRRPADRQRPAPAESAEPGLRAGGRGVPVSREPRLQRCKPRRRRPVSGHAAGRSAFQQRPGFPGPRPRPPQPDAADRRAGPPRPFRRPPRHRRRSWRPRRFACATGGEVILSGGAINSPQLLMLSGIGPGATSASDGHSRSCTTRPRSGRTLPIIWTSPCRPPSAGRSAIGIAPSFLPRALRAAWAYAAAWPGRVHLERRRGRGICPLGPRA